MYLFKSKTLIASGLLALVLSGCQSGGEKEDKTKENPQVEKSTDQDNQKEDHKQEMQSNSGEVPEGLQKAENPKFPVGSSAMMHADHMPGMNGVEATISGAFDTTAYAVTYTPTTGGKPVENHKWVIHEELVDPGKAPLEPGTEVKLDADHMKGMKGADATIDSAKQTTVYMVDFKPKDSDKEIKNHKWVIEDELSAE